MTAPNTTDAYPPRDTPPMDTPTTKPARKRAPKRKARTYTVAIQTDGHQSVTTLDKSGPLAAASNVVRSHVKALQTQQEHKVWVRSHSKYHPYSVIRNYENPKHRRFSITKTGPSVSLKEGKLNEEIPSSIRS